MAGELKLTLRKVLLCLCPPDVGVWLGCLAAVSVKGIVSDSGAKDSDVKYEGSSSLLPSPYEDSPSKSPEPYDVLDRGGCDRLMSGTRRPAKPIAD